MSLQLLLFLFLSSFSFSFFICPNIVSLRRLQQTILLWKVKTSTSSNHHHLQKQCSLIWLVQQDQNVDHLHWHERMSSIWLVSNMQDVYHNLHYHKWESNNNSIGWIMVAIQRSPVVTAAVASVAVAVAMTVVDTGNSYAIIQIFTTYAMYVIVFKKCVPQWYSHYIHTTRSSYLSLSLSYPFYQPFLMLCNIRNAINQHNHELCIVIVICCKLLYTTASWLLVNIVQVFMSYAEVTMWFILLKD